MNKSTKAIKAVKATTTVKSVKEVATAKIEAIKEAVKEVVPVVAKNEKEINKAFRGMLDNENKLDAMFGKRSTYCAEILQLLGYNEKAPKAACIAVYKAAVTALQVNMRAMVKDVADMVFDDTNKRYTAIKQQFEKQTKTGRLQGKELAAGDTTGTKKKATAKPAENADTDKTVIVREGNVELSYDVIADSEGASDSMICLAGEQPISMYEFVCGFADEINAVIQSHAGLLDGFMASLKLGQKA